MKSRLSQIVFAPTFSGLKILSINSLYYKDPAVYAWVAASLKKIASSILVFAREAVEPCIFSA
jgi:hypothetical protein